MKLVNPHKIKILAQTKRTTLRNIKKWGEEGSKLNDFSGFSANSWRARRLRSPPLEHRWPGREPGLVERTLGWPS